MTLLSFGRRMTKQEIFDKVARHLLTQKQKSVSSGNSCRYRGPKDTKCAIGCLIPDDKWTPKLEGAVARDLIVAKAAGLRFSLNENELGEVKGPQIDLATILQQVHDLSRTKIWFSELKKVAAIYKLSVKVLKEFPNWKCDE